MDVLGSALSSRGHDVNKVFRGKCQACNTVR